MEDIVKMIENKITCPVVTILTPVFNEEQNLPIYEKAVTGILQSRKDYNFSFLFIDDGSSDRSWEIIREICSRNRHFSGIRLSRNYGSHTALSAGFANAKGDAIATLACDLQDPPEVILEFLEKWRSGIKIVWGRRLNREDDAWRILASNLFFKLIRRFAMPKGSKFTTGSFLLIDKQVAECFCRFHEHNRITFALVAWTGFEQAVVDYNRKKRMSGVSGWNFSKMIKTMYDAFIGFSYLPIRLMTLSGIFFSTLTIPMTLYLFFSWLRGNTLPGWTSLMVILAFFFGVQFLLMAISGEYLYRIYAEVVHRPLYFISERTGHLEPGNKDAK